MINLETIQHSTEAKYWVYILLKAKKYVFKHKAGSGWMVFF